MVLPAYLGGLALGIVEVGRHSHDSVLDILAQVGLGDLLHLGEDHGGHFLGSELTRLALNQHLDVRLVVLGHNLYVTKLD